MVHAHIKWFFLESNRVRSGDEGMTARIDTRLLRLVPVCQHVRNGIYLLKSAHLESLKCFIA